MLALLLMLGLAGCSDDQPAARPSVEHVRLDVQMTPQRIAWAQLGSGAPLLLLNGTGSPMSEWDPAFLSALSGSRRVIVFDYPGLGESTAAAVDSFARLAQVTVGLMDDLQLSRSDILGWSMGGFVAQEMLRRDPERVGKVVLVGTNPGGPRTRLGPKWVQEADSDPDGEDAAYLQTNYPRKPCAQRLGRAFLDRLVDAVNSGRYPQPKVPVKTYDAMVAAEDPWLRSSRNQRELATVTNPVLVMVGDGDVITPPVNSRVIAGTVPAAMLTSFDGAGHSVLFQEPDLSAGVIEGFLRGEPVAQRVAGTC